MNEHTLPEDFSRWPDSPFALLGVVPGVSERDLRRAYTRLIRIFKPEHFPEHFRRIREAYETARAYAPYYSAFEAPFDSPDHSAESPPTEQPESVTPDAGDPNTPAGQRPLFELPRSLEEELDEAWDWAIEGDEAQAYARLLELRDRYPERSETCLRLHCLLRAAPELDNRRDPCDFLAQSLRQTGGSGPCHELYRLEIEDNPGEALTERFAELLQATTQSGLLVTFVQWRWGAAGRRGCFEVIGNDLPGLRARLAFDEEIWLRLLAFAADQIAWVPTPTTSYGLSECLNEIAQQQHLQLRCPDVFDRLDFLERIAGAWHTLNKNGTVHADLLKLLSRFWTRPFSEVRRGVMGLLATISTEPEVCLTYLDKINEVSPPVLSLIGQMVDSYQWTVNLEDDDREPEELTVLAQHFLEENGDLRYWALRPRLLTFCLRERIEPDVIAQLAIRATVVLPEARLNKLVNDWPLRHIYRACTLFRN